MTARGSTKGGTPKDRPDLALAKARQAVVPATLGRRRCHGPGSALIPKPNLVAQELVNRSRSRTPECTTVTAQRACSMNAKIDAGHYGAR
jgi:hypothetical protein